MTAAYSVNPADFARGSSYGTPQAAGEPARTRFPSATASLRLESRFGS